MIFRRREGPPKKIDHKVSHGIYVFNPQEKVWLPADPSEALSGDGLKLLYFGNTKCAACTVFNVYWNLLADKVSKGKVDLRLVAVICGWFAGECSSEDAKRLFREYKVNASPTLVFLCGNSGSAVEVDRIEGVWDDKRLLNKALKILESECRKGD